MKYERLPRFLREFEKLPLEQQRKFRTAVKRDFVPAADAGAFAGDPPWPQCLRIHKLHGRNVYSLTWSFTSPDGRATFHIQQNEAGEALLVWRRIGDHSIYKDP